MHKRQHVEALSRGMVNAFEDAGMVRVGSRYLTVEQHNRVCLPDDRLFTPREAATRLGLSEFRLARLRSSGDGPEHMKLGNGRIVYPAGALNRYKAQTGA